MVVVIVVIVVLDKSVYLASSFNVSESGREF